jgi:hypothetical protein
MAIPISIALRYRCIEQVTSELRPTTNQKKPRPISPYVTLGTCSRQAFRSLMPSAEVRNAQGICR